jgi:hypothetical protein
MAACSAFLVGLTRDFLIDALNRMNQNGEEILWKSDLWRKNFFERVLNNWEESEFDIAGDSWDHSYSFNTMLYTMDQVFTVINYVKVDLEQAGGTFDCFDAESLVRRFAYIFATAELSSLDDVEGSELLPVHEEGLKLSPTLSVFTIKCGVRQVFFRDCEGVKDAYTTSEVEDIIFLPPGFNWIETVGYQVLGFETPRTIDDIDQSFFHSATELILANLRTINAQG